MKRAEIKVSYGATPRRSNYIGGIYLHKTGTTGWRRITFTLSDGGRGKGKAAKKSGTYVPAPRPNNARVCINFFLRW